MVPWLPRLGLNRKAEKIKANKTNKQTNKQKFYLLPRLNILDLSGCVFPKNYFLSVDTCKMKTNYYYEGRPQN